MLIFRLVAVQLIIFFYFLSKLSVDKRVINDLTCVGILTCHSFLFKNVCNLIYH